MRSFLPRSQAPLAGRVPVQFDSSPTALAHYPIVDVFASFEDARADWLALSREATISPYQSFDFLSAWFSVFGPIEGLAPFLIVARDASGRPDALLPLCLTDIGPLRFAAFLGGREANFNLPLLRPGAHHGQDSLLWLIGEAARRAPAPPDLYFLRNQPCRFGNFCNPLVLAPAQPSPSAAFATSLPASTGALMARVSRETRKKLRRKEARLAAFGEIRYEHQIGGTRARALVAALLEQKSARFPSVGAAQRDSLSALLGGLLDRGEDAGLELHGLSLDGRFVAAYAGLLGGGRFSAMLNSYDPGEEIARCSPGDLLLHALMRNLVERGVANFDLGAGEARYKTAVCEETIPLYDLIAPVSTRGALAAPLFAAFLRLKRRAKRSPAVLRNYYRMKNVLLR